MKNGLIVENYGTKRYYLNDLLHRVAGPAEEYVNGSKSWWVHGKKHRVDGPAEEYPNGTKFWFFNGELHRVNGPAMEFANGSELWYLHGKLHRGDGPAEDWSNGEKYWYFNDEQLFYPKEFKTMEAFIEKLNTDEEYSLTWINDINGIIAIIKNPTDKQKRLHAMKWKNDYTQ